MGKSPFSTARSVDPAAARLAPLLDRLVNYERRRPEAQVWQLQTLAAVLDRPGGANRCGRAVQVGGSKGKGTTGAYLDALARGAGLRAGVYSSPHVETLLERIRLHGEQVGLEELESALFEVLSFANGQRLQLTFFEAMTAAAATLFAREQLDLSVFEVGLGGRLDATTAMPVDASILTGIELEHTEILGSTIEAIAAEKAHVIRPGGTCFAAARSPAREVFVERAETVGARLLLLGEDFHVVQSAAAGTDLVGRLRLPDGRCHAITVLDGRTYELPAVALAAACFQYLWPDRPLCLDPLPRPALPGRFEVMVAADGHPTILDGAHTETSLRVVAAEIQRRWPGQAVVLLFATAAHKRWREGLSALLGLVDRVVVTDVSGIACEDPSAVGAWLRQRGVDSEIVPDVATGLQALSAYPGPRLVTGSFYLVGEVRRALDTPERPT